MKTNKIKKTQWFTVIVTFLFLCIAIFSDPCSNWVEWSGFASLWVTSVLFSRFFLNEHDLGGDPKNDHYGDE